MQLKIAHQTIYRYSESVDYTVQQLRLFPDSFEGQQVRAWTIEAPQDSLPEFRDGFGNRTALLTLDRPHRQVVLRVIGEVETEEMHGVVRGVPEPLPPAFYMRSTSRTRASEGLERLARPARAESSPLNRLHRLMNLVHLRILYEPGETHVATTADEALAHGRGVCQDHAHVFITCARLLGFPARYVSGYLWTAEAMDHDASHAWAEAWVKGLGWVGFDAANGVSPSESYVRMACGLDYGDAAPVRGVRRGGGSEVLNVQLQVQQARLQVAA
jgi:transglutaminase-like putative cysteine protease